MNTTFYLHFIAGTEDAEKAATLEGDKEPQFTGSSGFWYHWDANIGSWYVQYLGEQALLVIPRELETHLACDNPQFTLWRAKTGKEAAVVDRGAAIQGDYEGDARRLFRRRRFADCVAFVDNHVGNRTGASLQTIQVEGPPEVYAEYMQLICQRRIQPVRRLEPSWWRRALRI